MKTNDEVADWLKELKADRRHAVTKQMAFGNQGAMTSLKWVLDTQPDADAIALKMNELQVTRDEAVTDELATVAYGAMIEALKWVIRED